MKIYNFLGDRLRLKVYNKIVCFIIFCDVIGK